jgi:hypothetical protein
MILMRMLSVSRSFCARVPELGRYRMTGGLRLPRFGAVTKGKEGRPVAIQAELPMAPVAVDDGAGERAGGGEKKGQGNQVEVGLWQRWLGGWRSCLDWLVKPKKPHRANRRPVQTSFLLESVKVVRNDLADADLELVRVKKRRRTVTEKGSAMGTRSAAEGERPGLGRTAVRWLTAGRMS